MQRTRLSTLAMRAGDRLGQFFLNPWRRISLLLISLLLGVFVAEALVTTSGQAAYWDVVVGGIFSIFTEAVSIFAYRVRDGSNQGFLFKNVLNAFKIGFIYSLFLEALKIGS